MLFRSRSARTGRPFALFVIDLDRFKEINDQNGHAAGDATLRHLAGALKNRLRPNDFIVRYGGDEFCVILPETALQEAKPLAEALVEMARSMPLSWQGRSIGLTVSIGATVWSRKQPADVDRMLEQADQALYEVKRRGRDGHAFFAVGRKNAGVAA